ncbi:hypothetical protein M2101_001462 [Parabacteroides sp. PM5-20]|uniref:acyloxyacyl hydrolase n=1 Tax=Parabacteroides sp. PM5-20 TaxID=2940527 RepID=UPI001EF22CCA|nr:MULTISPECIES: acyloxyacyl hydrolase [unclassified Parabacteroides]MDH6534786.1 hypothetical protein [Parabacteroides sp. PM5-20]
MTRSIKSGVYGWKVLALSGVLFFLSDTALAQKEIAGNTQADSSFLSWKKEREKSDLLPDGLRHLPFSRRFIHRMEAELRPGYIVPTSSFLEGENAFWRPIERSFSGHLKYSFKYHPYTCTDRIYGGAYQGLGLAYYSLDNRKELGDPIAFYLFQGARISQFNPRLSLNYEWNFGLSFGWKPYDYEYNYYNKIIGSKINAYINLGFYLNLALSRQFDLTPGISLTHFSNGNTRFPNAGLNTVGVKLGLVYNFNRKDHTLSKPFFNTLVPEFPRHISYDLVLFGSWRRKGVVSGDMHLPSPEAYTVWGFNFAPMYNFGYKFRAGVSVDGIYDGSANVYTEDGYTFIRPSLDKQLALGLSGRAEFVMPYFTVGIGLGANILQAGGDLKAVYQILALKIEITRSSFLHIGYSLHDFHDPNCLMLGIGFRFNNKYPTLHR